MNWRIHQQRATELARLRKSLAEVTRTIDQNSGTAHYFLVTIRQLERLEQEEGAAMIAALGHKDEP